MKKVFAIVTALLFLGAVCVTVVAVSTKEPQKKECSKDGEGCCKDKGVQKCDKKEGTGCCKDVQKCAKKESTGCCKDTQKADKKDCAKKSCCDAKR